MDRKRSRNGRGGLVVEGVGLFLLCVGLLFCCVGCQSANGAVVTDADRASAAADLAFVSIADRPTVWRPVDDVSPLPKVPDPLPVTPSRSTPITLTSNGTATREPFDVTLVGDCADGSCDGGAFGDREFGDRPRRPIVRGVVATGRAVGFVGRAINRARPIRRIGGFLFRRRCG